MNPDVDIAKNMRITADLATSAKLKKHEYGYSSTRL